MRAASLLTLVLLAGCNSGDEVAIDPALEEARTRIAEQTVKLDEADTELTRLRPLEELLEQTTARVRELSEQVDWLQSEIRETTHDHDAAVDEKSLSKVSTSGLAAVLFLAMAVIAAQIFLHRHRSAKEVT